MSDFAPVVEFNDAMCKQCDWRTAKECGVNCGEAKRALHRVVKTYHPDMVRKSFPAWDVDLRPWATAAVTELTTDVSKFCKPKRHDEL